MAVHHDRKVVVRWGAAAIMSLSESLNRQGPLGEEGVAAGPGEFHASLL